MGFKFEKLDVWMRSIDFANQMFDVAEKLPNNINSQSVNS